ncbi:putative ribonuclease H-like domain-containing protein [Tanacetum coccineum]
MFQSPTNTRILIRVCKFNGSIKKGKGRKQERETDAGNYDIPLYSRFKQVEYKGVPHPLSGDYTPREQEEYDDSMNHPLKHMEHRGIFDMWKFWALAGNRGSRLEVLSRTVQSWDLLFWRIVKVVSVEKVCPPVAKIIDQLQVVFSAFALHLWDCISLSNVFKSAFLVYYGGERFVGLSPSPRAWYATLSTFLEQHGYKRGTIDKTLFIRRNKKDIMLVQVFQMSSMGELTFFLGLQVKQNKGGIFISQDKYVAEILKKFDLVNVQRCHSSLWRPRLPLTRYEEAFDIDCNSKDSHLNAVKRILLVLTGQTKLGFMVILWNHPLIFEAFSDRDYGSSNLTGIHNAAAAQIAVVKCCGFKTQLLDYGFKLHDTKIPHFDNESTIWPL